MIRCTCLRKAGLLAWYSLISSCKSFSTLDWEDDLTHRPIRASNGSFGDPVEDAFFVCHPLEFVQVLLLDPLLSAHIDFVNEMNEQID